MVYVLLADGFEEMEAVAPMNLLRRAGIAVTPVGVSGPVVTGGLGLALQTECALDAVDVEKMEMLVLPGGAKGHKILGQTPAVAELVAKAVSGGRWVAAICAAPVLLARWGYLKGRRAVCYPSMEEELIQHGAEPNPADVVRDGRFITARAAGSSIAFGLALVHLLKGEDQAQKVRHAIHYRM